MKITESRLKQIIKEEMAAYQRDEEKEETERLRKQFPDYSEQEILAMAKAMKALPRGSSDPRYSQGVSRLEKKPELRRLGISEQELKEIEFGLTSPLDARMRAASAEKINPIRAYIEELGFPPQVERGMLAHLDQLVNSPGGDEALQDARSAVEADDHKRLFSILAQVTDVVDPEADTEEVSAMDAPTVRTRQLNRENKKISKSDLQQMIIQELKTASKKD